MVTSFVKLAVVFAILRQAIGTQQLPPTQIITGLSVVLTMYIMAPVGLEIYHNGVQRLTPRDVRSIKAGKVDPKTVVLIGEIAQAPVRGFLIKHAHDSDRRFFHRLATKVRTGRKTTQAIMTTDDFRVVTPAFVMSELKEAFQIGFILFLPMLIIDMTVANILMALGMQMLSPTTLSLPFKVLLFVMVDGWHLITKGLIIGYL